MATARFPDGATYEIADSDAKHMVTGDVVIVPDATELPDTGDTYGTYKAHRVGIVTRRVWTGTTIRVDLFNYPTPIPD